MTDLSQDDTPLDENLAREGGSCNVEWCLVRHSVMTSGFLFDRYCCHYIDSLRSVQ